MVARGHRNAADNARRAGHRLADSRRRRFLTLDGPTLRQTGEPRSPATTCALSAAARRTRPTPTGPAGAVSGVPAPCGMTLED